MWYDTIRMGIGLVLLLIVWRLMIKSPIVNKKTTTIKLSVIGLVLTIALTLTPFENLFYTFPTLQSVFNYTQTEEIKLFVNGEKSSFVLYGGGASSSLHKMYARVEDGYKIDTSVPKLVLMKSENSSTFMVYQYQNTDDYYVYVISRSDENSADISDNISSEFKQLVGLQEQTQRYYITSLTYVNDIDENYEITVNGNVVAVGRDIN